MPIQTLAFQVAFDGGKVDHDNAVIHNVAVITGDVEAEGHDLIVDNTTVAQLFQAANKTGQVPVNLDHGSGIKDTCGFLTNFRVAGKKLRADWHLLETHEETPRMLERADRMPGCFGLSVKFKGRGEKKALKKFARCEKLLSVDCVTQPAAYPDGLFSVPVDSRREGDMRNRNTQSRTTPAAEEPPTLEDIAELLTKQSETLADLGSRIEAIEQGGPETQNDLDSENGEGLLTDAEIDQLVAQGELLDNGDGTFSWADGSAEGEAVELAGAGAAVGADAGTAAMSAIHEINQFRAQLRTQQLHARQAEEDNAFAALDERIDALVAQNEELVTQLQAAQEQNSNHQEETPENRGDYELECEEPAGDHASLVAARAMAGPVKSFGLSADGGRVLYPT